MKKIAILYGSSLGNTKFIAEEMAKHVSNAILKSVSEINQADIESYDSIILGTSTWGVGGLQDDFSTFVDTLVWSNLSGKTIALFGCGDQQTYPDTYCNAIGRLYDLIQDKECKIVGEWSIDGYDFSQSLAVRDGVFLGLPLDEENQPDLSDYRIKKWMEQIICDID